MKLLVLTAGPMTHNDTMPLPAKGKYNFLMLHSDFRTSILRKSNHPTSMDCIRNGDPMDEKYRFTKNYLHKKATKMTESKNMT